jgi:hypothetical protein
MVPEKIIKGSSNHRDSLAETSGNTTTLKALSFALAIRVKIIIIKCNALDSKSREIIPRESAKLMALVTNIKLFDTGGSNYMLSTSGSVQHRVLT